MINIQNNFEGSIGKAVEVVDLGDLNNTIEGCGVSGISKITELMAGGRQIKQL
ncbi:MAG: hypothetical protein QM532_00725 [Cyanobium sp. MAG06]|nr:hypothetical protein [Cyanobium sp. MAG06]